jgi:hypothetical protein
LVPTVEAALTTHFGSPVSLVLDVDDAAAQGVTARAAEAPRGAGDQGHASVEEVDPAEFADQAAADAPDDASAAEARLLEAFPGASEVAG